jgi:pimeloyl-ACP methyl ester carboxylesterase
MQTISFLTSDGVTIVGNLWQTKSTASQKPAVLLLHMMPAKKESWDAFARQLHELDHTVLAIDLRGHGESTKGAAGSLNYHNFDDADHKGYLLDAEAALEFLKSHTEAKSFIIIGASIGANTAINIGTEKRGVRGVVALSPGLNYRGIATEDSVRTWPKDRELLLLASKEDQYAAASVAALALIPNVSACLLDNAGHGTDMLENASVCKTQLMDWIQKIPPV